MAARGDESVRAAGPGMRTSAFRASGVEPVARAASYAEVTHPTYDARPLQPGIYLLIGLSAGTARAPTRNQLSTGRR
ncbi:hypothetical protein GCM10010176_026490 [Nonomuraea spiralis]|nr:hypothetical protein GCM10010176_026490 [Nonomuraea spiralis]